MNDGDYGKKVKIPPSVVEVLHPTTKIIKWEDILCVNSIIITLYVCIYRITYLCFLLFA